MDDQNKEKQASGTETLEEQQTVVESSQQSAPATPAPSDANELSGDNTDAADQAADEALSAKKSKKRSVLNLITTHLNIYLLMFLLLLVVAGGAILVTYQTSKRTKGTTEIKFSDLTPEDLKALQSSSTTVGDPKSILNVESNAVFAGKVLVRDSLDVAGTIKVGGALSLPGLTVTGPSNFDEVRANNVTISNNASILGQLTVQRSLSVTGGATFGGAITAPQLNIENLQISSDIILNRHIDAGGATPDIAFGGALGAGGTASVSGTDTAGTVNINTGGGPISGLLATITFKQKFNATPHVVVTPVGIGASGLNYYISRTTSGFSLFTANAPSAGTSFSFDFIVID